MKESWKWKTSCKTFSRTALLRKEGFSCCRFKWVVLLRFLDLFLEVRCVEQFISALNCFCSTQFESSFYWGEVGEEKTQKKPIQPLPTLHTERAHKQECPCSLLQHIIGEQPPAVSATKKANSVSQMAVGSLALTVCLCISWRMLCFNMECGLTLLYQVSTCLRVYLDKISPAGLGSDVTFNFQSSWRENKGERGYKTIAWVYRNQYQE